MLFSKFFIGNSRQDFVNNKFLEQLNEISVEIPGLSHEAFQLTIKDFENNSMPLHLFDIVHVRLSHPDQSNLWDWIVSF